jgi:hypothetical protein
VELSPALKIKSLSKTKQTKGRLCKGILMVSKAFAAVILTFNITMGLLIFLSSQLILLSLVGYEVGSVSASISYGIAQPPGGTPIPTRIFYPIPNYPFYLFIFALIVNFYFAVKLRKKKE